MFSNSDDRSFAVKTLKVEPERAVVMPNGLPPHLVGLPAPQPHDGRALRIAVVGTHIARKGVKYGMEALNGWLREDENSSASLLGTGVPDEVVLAGVDASVRPRIRIVARYERPQLPVPPEGP